MTQRRQTADHNLMRAINRALILRHLRVAAPQSRANLAARTGLMRSTVSSLVDELIAANLVHEIGTGPSSGGRPGTLLALNPAGGCAIGVEITPDAVVVLLTDFLAQPRWQRQVALDTTDVETVIAQAERVIDAALDYNARTDATHPFGIGLGIAGLVNAGDGIVRSATNLGWRNVAIRARWEERFGLPVRVGNEASIAALGEHYFGAAGDVTDFIYLGLSARAIGAGLLIGGRLYQGIDGYAGEVGHMLIDPAGPQCTCGRCGCWEALWREACSTRQIQAHLAAEPDSLVLDRVGGDPARVTIYTLLDAARAGDDFAAERTAQVCTWLAAGIANLINIFNPQMIVLGGPLGVALAPHLDTIRHLTAERVAMPRESAPALVSSQITSNACALGAVALVLDDLLSQPAWPGSA